MMKNKDLIRVAVLAVIFAWPGVEFCRYCVATQELAASQEREQKVSRRLAEARVKHAQEAQVVRTELKTPAQEP